MEKEFVPYDIALAMKELGFNESCLAAFVNEKLKGCGAIYFEVDGLYNNFGTGNEEQPWIATPLYQQAFRWFREKYNLWGKAGFVDEFYTDYSNSDYTQISEIRHEYNPEMTAEETTDVIKREEINCLKTLIKVVKNKYQ